MTRTVRRRFRTALFALCALLVTQWTLAAHACPVMRLPVAPAPMQSAQPPAVNPEHGCHEATDAGRAQPSFVDAALCKKHCDEDGQTSGTSAAVAIDAPVFSGLRVSLSPQRLPLTLAAAPDSGDATAPPISILYCVFLT
jgi:hypothetical protein